MDNRFMGVTRYFRSAVAAQANMGIDFKVDYFSMLSINEIVQGRINPAACKEIFAEEKKNTFDDKSETKKKTLINVIICAKTLKTILKANEKVQNTIGEMTGIYYIPAILSDEGLLLFDGGEKRIPWFPREYLIPMVEPKLAIGNADVVDSFTSKSYRSG